MKRTITLLVALGAVSLLVFPAQAGRAVPSGPQVAGNGVAMVYCDAYEYGPESWCPYAVTDAMSLTLVPGDGDTWFSLCGRFGWCGFTGALWETVFHAMSCSIVQGDTWYGGIRLPQNGSQYWWAFKIDDGGVADDRVGLRLTRSPGSGPCGAGDVTTWPVLAGDFRILRP